MPAFTATYSENQRRALLRAVLAEGMTVAGALRAAKAGELPELSAEDQADLGKMTYSYACTLIKQERDNRDGVQRARSAPNTVAKDAAVYLLRRAEKDAQKIANAQKPTMDTDAALKTLRVIEAAQKVLQGLEPKQKAKGEQDTEPKAPLSLAQRIARGASTEPEDPHTTTNDGDSHALARNGDDDSTTDEATASSAHVSVEPAAAGALVGVAVPSP